MSSSPRSHGPRSKNACDPCRRKKTKCPGEQPACSFCQRLNQRCTYTNLNQSTSKTGRIQKAHRDSSCQITRLQAQVDQMNSAIQALTRQSRLDHHATQYGAAPQSTSDYREDGPSIDGNPGLQLSSSACPFPSPDVMIQLIEIYRCKIHLQPFPLFDPDQLFAQWSQWPPYILQSFLATVLAFTDPLLHANIKSNTMEDFYRLARAVVIPAVTEGAFSLPLLQSLCLLTIYDLAAKNEARVSINISIATNLAKRMDRMFKSNDQRGSGLSEAEGRCYCTVFILERTFTRGPYILQLDVLLNTDTSAIKAPSNPPPIHNSGLLHSAAASAAYGTSSKSNIILGSLQLFSLWGRIVEYITKMQFGRPEKAWLTSSIYADLEAEFYKFETSLPQMHRIKNIGLTNRSREEVAQYREYWSCWLSLQTTIHTGQALLNHPLIHLFGHDRSTTESGTITPPSFLQQTIDQAILHAGWTIRLIRIAEDIGIVINDPIIGHQLFISATIHWIFSFASDSHVSERALLDLDQSLRFLREISSRWPHFSEKLTALGQLQTLTKQTYGVLGQRGLPVSISTILWDLIDPCKMGTDILLLGTINGSGERIPTEHLARLHERSKSNSHQQGNESQATGNSLAPLMQFPSVMLDEDLVYPPESLSDFFDSRFLAEFDSIEGL